MTDIHSISVLDLFLKLANLAVNHWRTPVWLIIKRRGISLANSDCLVDLLLGLLFLGLVGVQFFLLVLGIRFIIELYIDWEMI